MAHPSSNFFINIHVSFWKQDLTVIFVNFIQSISLKQTHKQVSPCKNKIKLKNKGEN